LYDPATCGRLPRRDDDDQGRPRALRHHGGRARLLGADLLGVFHDKTSIEADRTGGPCDGNVYFAWSRFNSSGANEIYFVRSTGHGVTCSSPMRLSRR
jgi:hypothetical protein